MLPSLVYFLQHPADSFIKIGVSAHFSQRLRALQEEYGPLHLLGVMEGTRKTEQKLHQQFHPLRRFGEWFRPEPELLTFIEDHTLRWHPTPSFSTHHLAERHLLLRWLYLSSYPDGWTDSELALLLNVARTTIWRVRLLLRAHPVGNHRYLLLPSPTDRAFALHILRVCLLTGDLSEEALYAFLTQPPAQDLATTFLLSQKDPHSCFSQQPEPADHGWASAEQ